MVVTAQAQHGMDKHPEIEPESDFATTDSGTTFLIHSTGLPFTGQLLVPGILSNPSPILPLTFFIVIINCVFSALLCNEEMQV